VLRVVLVFGAVDHFLERNEWQLENERVEVADEKCDHDVSNRRVNLKLERKKSVYCKKLHMVKSMEILLSYQGESGGMEKSSLVVVDKCHDARMNQIGTVAQSGQRHE
jgi:hypothetical protein